MKKLNKNLLLLSSALLFMIPESASALPGFARQTGKTCISCHTQNMPKLNSEGRHFALSGYTLYADPTETKPLIEGSEIALGLPPVLNVSAVLKANYNKTSQPQDVNSTDIVGAQRGELRVLEGSGIYFGGRFADNVGGIISLNGDPSKENDVVFGGKAVVAYPAFNGFTGISLSSTQINGTFAGMENYNTGLNAPLRQFENANMTNAAQATGIARGPATGLQIYYGDDTLFATVGITVPSQNNEGIDAGRSMIPFGRIAYNQTIGQWNFMLGAYGINGDVKASDQSLDGGLITSGANLINIHKEAYGFDLEATGDIAGMPSMTTLNIVMKNIVDVEPSNLLLSTNLQTTDNNAASLEFQVNPVTPLGIKLAYLFYDNNYETAANKEFIKTYDFSSYSLGFNYLLRQNILIDLEYSHTLPKLDTIKTYYDLYLSATLAF
ncbi:hypothetical protein KJ877_05795 [bacterium]|nr:hypothetical protein [bacterium]MBU1989696.1 hypothetical protein [bacterium]